MPRIDPHQLLSCLSVLLSPTGGIKSKDEVQRLAGLMTKFSKKLVSKCIYVHILKNTSTDLIGMFMGVGGWHLTNSWLADAVEARNWPLMQELLELLLMCPVDVDRLKLNNCPKLVKGLSKDSTNKNVQLLATRLVDQWLQIVKGPSGAGAAVVAPPQTATGTPVPAVATTPSVPPKESVVDANSEAKAVMANGPVEEVKDGDEELEDDEDDDEEEEERSVCIENGESATGGLVYKITIKDGKQIVAKVNPDKISKRPSEDEAPVDAKVPLKRKIKQDDDEDEEEVKKVKSDTSRLRLKPKVEKVDKDKKSVRDVSKRSSKAEVKSESKSSSRTTDKKDKYPSKNGHSDRNRSEKERDRTKDSKEREKHKSSSGKEKEKGKSSEYESAQAEKDKATLAKLIPPSITKMGKIPKKPSKEEAGSDTKAETKGDVKPSRPINPPVVPEVKKKSISIETRKPTPEGRPKTVKTFNSKFRSTGLEEEVKPPPPRAVVKKAAPVVAPALVLDKKRASSSPPQSPSLEMSPSMEKKRALGGPPSEPVAPLLSANKLADKSADKAKRSHPTSTRVLMESDCFMDALTAANIKKEPKKRKRRASNSRDEPPAKGAPKVEGEGHQSPPSSPSGDSDHGPVETASPVEKKPVFKFYQETLQLNDDESKESPEEKKPIKENDQSDDVPASKEELVIKEEPRDRTPTPTPEDEDEATAAEAAALLDEAKRRRLEDREARERESRRIPKGVLVFHRSRPTAKKSVRWKGDSELEAVQFFELDETERVNVTKTFMDMKQMERINERENLARRTGGEDTMKEQTIWTRLIPIDLEPSDVVPGQKSREKEIQYAREMNTPPVNYMYGMIPDNPAEPDAESHPVKDPIPIPLDDVTGNAVSINDFTNTPWPEAKTMPSPSPPQPHMMHGDGFHPQMVGPTAPLMPFPAMHHQQSMGLGPDGPMTYQPGMTGPMDPSMMHMGPGGTPGGDWRTGDGKVVVPDMGGVPGMQPMPGVPIEMYHQGGMEGGWGGPDMNYPMMGHIPGPNMGGPYGMQQGFHVMGGGPVSGPAPGLMGPGPGGPGGPSGPGPGVPVPGGPGGPGGPPGFMRGGGGHRGRGWYRGGGGSGGGGDRGDRGGDNWRGGRGRGGWSGQKRPTPICHYFRKGNCHTPNCQFQHPADLKRHGGR